MQILDLCRAHNIREVFITVQNVELQRKESAFCKCFFYFTFVFARVSVVVNKQVVGNEYMYGKRDAII